MGGPRPDTGTVIVLTAILVAVPLLAASSGAASGWTGETGARDRGGSTGAASIPTTDAWIVKDETPRKVRPGSGADDGGLGPAPATPAPAEGSVLGEGPCETPGPDAAGYTCEALPDGFESVASTGTPVLLFDDDVSDPVSLNFTFPFYGEIRTEVRISSNGFLTFDAGDGFEASGCCQGQEVPAGEAPNDLIAGYWEDLNPSAGGAIHYDHVGEAPNRTFVVQFTAVPHFPANHPVTFQVRLAENGTVDVLYREAVGDGDLVPATGGIESDSGDIGLRYRNGDIDQADTAVRYNSTSPASLPPPPANDDFANATDLGGVPAVANRSTVLAALEDGEPQPCGDVGSTVWYEITPDQSVVVTADTFGSGYDTVLAAYAGSTLGSLSNLACDDDTDSLQSQVEFQAQAGETYRLQVGGYAGDAGDLDLNVETPETVIRGPDLVVEDVTLDPQDPVDGDRVSFTATVENRGNDTADATSTGFQIDAPDGPSTTVETPALDPGEAVEVTTDPSPELSAGNHTITAGADAASDVGELNETNNTRLEAFQVAEPPLPGTACQAPCEKGFDGSTVEDVNLTGLWHVDSRCDDPPSAPNYLGYHGDGDCTYDTGGANSGLATLAANVSSAEDPVVVFEHRHETEALEPFDVMRVEASSDGSSWSTLANYTGDDPIPWTTAGFPLPGSSDVVYVRWTFDTVDGLFNRHEGWLLDDVRVRDAGDPDPSVADVAVEKGSVRTDFTPPVTSPTQPYEVTVDLANDAEDPMLTGGDLAVTACPQEGVVPIPRGGCETVGEAQVQLDAGDEATVEVTWDQRGAFGDWEVCAHLDYRFSQPAANDEACQETFVLAGGTGAGGTRLAG